jgi:hypothetical protein
MDGVSDSLAKILTQLTQVEAKMKSISGSSSGVRDAIRASIGAGAMGLGAGGAGNSMANSLGAFSGRGAIATGAFNLGKGVMNAIPNLGDALQRTSGYYDANIRGNSGLSQNRLAAITMGSANRLGISSPTSMASTSALLSMQGIAYGNTALTRTGFTNAIAESTSAYARLGIQNEAAAQSISSIYRGPMASQLYRVGINVSSSRTGQTNSLTNVANQLYGRFYGGKKVTSDQILRSYQGGILGQQLNALGFDENTQMMMLDMFQQRAGGKPINYSKPGGVNAALGRSKAQGNQSPYALLGEANAARADAIDAATDKLIAGFTKAVKVYVAANEAFARNVSKFGALLEAKGFIQGMKGLQGGDAAVGAVSSLLGTAGGYLVGRGLFNTAKNILGGGASKGRHAAPKASLLGRGANILSRLGGLFAKGGKFAKFGGRLLPGVGAAITIGDAIKTGYQDDDWSWKNFGGSVGAGAISGTFMGGPWGALAGGIVGGLSYGGGYLFGKRGLGAKGDSNTPKTKGHSSTGTGLPRTVGQAVSWALKEVQNSSENWFERCETFVEAAYGRRYRYDHPHEHWAVAVREGRAHTGKDAPPGAMVIWGGGTYGHVALSLGGGKIISTDILRRGKPDVTTIDHLTRAWGKPYRGWVDPAKGHPLNKNAAPIAASVSTGVSSHPASRSSSSRSALDGRTGFSKYLFAPPSLFGEGPLSTSEAAGVSGSLFSLSGSLGNAGDVMQNLYGFTRAAGNAGLPGYSQGAWNLSKDHTANVHAGEMIIPAGTAEVLRNAMRESLAGQGGGKTVNVTLKIEKASDEEAMKFAKQVKKLWENDNHISTLRSK